MRELVKTVVKIETGTAESQRLGGRIYWDANY